MTVGGLQARNKEKNEAKIELKDRLRAVGLLGDFHKIRDGIKKLKPDLDIVVVYAAAAERIFPALRREEMRMDKKSPPNPYDLIGARHCCEPGLDSENPDDYEPMDEATYIRAVAEAARGEVRGRGKDKPNRSGQKRIRTQPAGNFDNDVGDDDIDEGSVESEWRLCCWALRNIHLDVAAKKMTSGRYAYLLWARQNTKDFMALREKLRDKRRQAAAASEEDGGEALEKVEDLLGRTDEGVEHAQELRTSLEEIHANEP